MAKPKIKAIQYGNSNIQAQIDAVKDIIAQSVKDDVIALALNIHGRLVDNPPEGTPVDTGWASANWWLSVGSIPSNNDGVPSESASVASRQAQQSTGTTSVLSYTMDKGVIYITNHTAYISKLNSGSSKQSPAGFADNAVQVELTRFTHTTDYRAIDQ